MATQTVPVDFSDSLTLSPVLAVENPQLWSAESPALYRVQVVLRDGRGRALDDYVLTTGLRTVDQQGGHFRLNGKVSMLNGAQIMGFRGPIEKTAIWLRCPPVEWIVKELLMVKKMNGNQDAPTGYRSDWSVLRQWPGTYRQTMLDSPERAYFDFEHQESMGQPNWELLRGKPYYRVHSYEWNYDEGTIGRRLTLDEWQASQSWQAFSAWEAMKKLRMLDYDGFSWCTLHGGPNSGTYMKPIIDVQGHAKLAYWANRMVFQPTVAGSGNVDIVYGPDDALTPVVLHWGEARRATLTITIQNEAGETVEEKTFADVALPAGRQSVALPAFKPSWRQEGHYRVLYRVD